MLIHTEHTRSGRSHERNRRASSLIGRLLIASCCILPGAFLIDRANGHPAENREGQAQSRRVENACAAEEALLKDRLRGVFRTQLAGGALNFRDADALLEQFPLLATLCLETYRLDRDASFLSQAYASIARYLNYLYVERDTDGDFLVESPDPQCPGRTLEPAAFNALLALDLHNLTRICLKLHIPLRGLFWYDGARTIETRLIEATYDADANTFSPVESVTHAKEHIDDPLSMLPAAFLHGIGENFSSAMLRNDLLKSQRDPKSGPQRPSRQASTVPHRISEQLLRTLLIAEMLKRNGFLAESHAYLKDHLPDLKGIQGGNLSRESATLGEFSGERAYAGFLSCLLTNNRADHAFFPVTSSLKLFAMLAHTQHILSESEVDALNKSLRRLESILHPEPVEPNRGGAAPSPKDGEATLADVRQVYRSISSVKDRMKRASAFTLNDRSEIPGFDFDGAFSDLMRDAVEILRRAENALFDLQERATGFRLTRTLLKERAVVGETITLRLDATVNRAALEIQSILLARGGVIDTLMAATVPVVVHPGGESLTLEHRFSVPSDWEPGIHTLPFTADIRLGSGERRLLHFRKSVYIEAPVSFRAAFPEGRILKDWTLPIDIELVKNAPYAVVMQTGWYSASGLKLREGNTYELYIPEGQDSASVRFHVLAPSPCRPGSFPFLLKIFANNLDIGTVSSSFFKHYQWTFVGPLPSKGDPIARVYPPENDVNLLESLRGIDERIFWRMLPSEACFENGEIHLGDLLSPGGVGYLYTVIQSSRDMRSSVFLSTNASAVLFINGARILESRDTSASAPSRSSVTLREGLNTILIKTVGGEGTRVFFSLGDKEGLTSDEFNNNLWELVHGFKDFYERRINQIKETGEVQKLVTIHYYDPEANSVSVIGTFNGWSPESSRLREVSDGVWEITLHLLPGKYAYRLLINNRQQILDPRCSIQEPDGYGGKNSVLYIE